MADEKFDPQSGFYKDRTGREWFCVRREGSMSCTSEHSYTSAYLETFKVWGWEPVSDTSMMEGDGG